MPALNGIVGIATIKNEADIIEPMIRHNLRFLDSLVVVDNCSSDQSLATVLAMREEFPGRLIVRRDARMGHVQRQILNDLAIELAAQGDIACLVPLDADELIRADRSLFRQTLLQEIRPVRMPWVTYVPTPLDEQDEKNPICRITRRRQQEPKQWFKTTFPIHLVGQAELSPGNHRLIGKGHTPMRLRGFRPRPPKPDLAARTVAGLSLAHYPVRSREQLFTKVVIGALNMRLRTGGKTREGFHWHEAARTFIENRGMSDAEFYDTARRYAVTYPVALVEDPLDLHDADRPLRFPVEDQAQLVLKLLGFAQECVDAFGTPPRGVRQRWTKGRRHPAA